MSSERLDDDDGRTASTEYDPNPTESGKWISAVIALIGLWLIVEGVWFDLVDAQMWNDVIVGALLAVVGGYNYYRRADEELGNLGAAGIAALLGLWLVVTPFVLGVREPAAEAGIGVITAETMNTLGFWNDIIVGLVVLVLGAYSAYKIRDRRREVATATT